MCSTCAEMDQNIEDLGSMTEVVEQVADGDLVGVAEKLGKLAIS